MNNRGRQFLRQFEDANFLKRLGQFEGLVSKVLSLAMIVVVFVIVIDLGIVLTKSLMTSSPEGFFGQTLTDIFGLFLSVLIALEILENITAYIKKHVVQVELVIATALTAVGRKIIILDLSKISGLSLIGLAIAIFSLAISYWIVRTTHK
ncbi:MAG: phosphate-starvation-inducible PsiE family protein [Leptolyngbyaceae cyanobacterium SM2_3_12]|nr:phosphate-starvation-inducible PsiE family protein [Leptolyngbyaceae cyanobacterium SM2_3_12]